MFLTEKYRCVPKIASPVARNICYRKLFEKYRCVPKFASPQARKTNRKNWFDKYCCVPKIASPEAWTKFKLKNWFGKYRCVPEIASPKARRKSTANGLGLSPQEPLKGRKFGQRGAGGKIKKWINPRNSFQKFNLKLIWKVSLCT